LKKRRPKGGERMSFIKQGRVTTQGKVKKKKRRRKKDIKVMKNNFA